MIAAAIVLGIIACFLIGFTLFTAWRHPHLRNIAVRNVKKRKVNTILTMIGSMVGTALITSALLLHTSIAHSIDQFFEQQFGSIRDDVPAAGQAKLQHPAFLSEDLERLKEDLRKESNDSTPFLPTVGTYANLMKLNEDGKPIIIQPKVYIHAFERQQATLFDPKGSDLIPNDLQDQEIILSERAAAQLEVKLGDSISLQVPEAKRISLKVKKIVPEQGITGYRGDQNGTATGIVTFQTARQLTGLKEGYNHVLLSTDPYLKGWKSTHVRFQAETNVDGIQKFVPFFIVASLNAIIIGIVLVLNIFKMIGDERQQELGILRALGMNRSDLARILRLEGMMYAVGSSLFGVIAGVAICKIAMWKLGEILRLAIQYESQVEMKYQFFFSMEATVTGLSIGILIVYLSMVLISRKVSRVSILHLLQDTYSLTPVEWTSTSSKIKNMIALLLGLIAGATIIVPNLSAFQKWIGNMGALTTMINIGCGLLAIITTFLFILLMLPYVFAVIRQLFRKSSMWFGLLGIAFRYPQVNKKRTGLLLFMFVMVLFLTGFAGIINETFSSIFVKRDGRVALGGFDLAANAQQLLTTQDIEKMLKQSTYVNNEEIAVSTSVWHVPYQEEFPSHMNGIDEEFAKHNQLKLTQRDPSFASDRSVWEEVARNPQVVVISDTRVSDNGSILKVGDALPDLNKKVIGIVQYQAEHYTFDTSSGIWMKQSELKQVVKDPRLIQSVALIQVKNPERLAKVASDISKEFTLQGIYPLRNPQQYFMAATLFAQTLFSLLEVFSALATVTGITGLMIIMFRMVRERRQQIGMMRANGISKRFVYWGIFSEGFIIAMTGIVLGIGLGSYTGVLMINSAFDEGGNIIQIVFPYLKISAYLVGALCVTMLCSALPARQTLKLSPVEATRYIS